MPEVIPFERIIGIQLNGARLPVFQWLTFRLIPAASEKWLGWGRLWIIIICNDLNKMTDADIECQGLEYSWYFSQ